MKVKEKILTQWDLVKARSDELMAIKEPETMTQDFIDTLGHKYLLNSLEVETKAIGHRGIIKGFGSTYDVDMGGDRIIPGAFRDDLPKFAINPMMLFSHQMNMILGKWTMFEEQAQGLYMEGEINLKTQLGKDTYTLIGDNDLKGLSIGYSILKRAYDDENEILELMKLRLWEVSVVAIPMNQNSWITATKIFGGADVKEVEQEDKFDIDKVLPHEDWKQLALAMAKLLGGRGGVDLSGEVKEDVFEHLEEHYEKLEKKVPEFKGELEDVEFKDVDWQEDEKFIMECANLDGSLQASMNILKYFLKNDRIQSVELDRIKEVQKLLEEINPQEVVTNTTESDPNDKELDELLAICKTLKTSIVSVKKFDINEVVVDEIKSALSKATGKVIK